MSEQVKNFDARLDAGNKHVIKIDSLSCGYCEREVLHDISFEMQTGEALCLLGPNGVGKSTLFKTILGFIKPIAGRICFDGQDMSSWHRKQYGQTIGYIPQSHSPSFAFTVFEVVLMGRTPFLNGISSAKKHDEEIAHNALEQLGIDHLADRNYVELSGGERQMVLVARALAQQPTFLMMDEPTASLDMGNQSRVLERIYYLASAGYGVVMTTHDPNQAFLLDSKVICVSNKSEIVCGRANEVLTQECLKNLYGTDICLGDFSCEGQEFKACVPYVRR